MSSSKPKNSIAKTEPNNSNSKKTTFSKISVLMFQKT